MGLNRDVEAAIRRRLAALTLEQKVRLLTGADFWSLHPEPAIGLQPIVTSDGPAGVRGEVWDERNPSANVPSPTALAATWDEARIERVGALLADEARRKGVHVLLAPTVNLHRTPYGGRHFECFSEDPLLTARIGAAYVRGVQSNGIAATVKHFVANDSETERFTVDVRVDERSLRELYLAPFESIVRDADAWAVMAAYNSVNGTTMTEHPMLREVLKEEWGFDGVVMSDWFATRSTESAGNAGLDLAMPGPSGPWGEALVTAVRDGRVAEAAVDDKVLRLLRLAGRVGTLDGIEPAAPPAEHWTGAQVAAELRATAAASFVLARNDSATLPLDGSRLRRVALVGPNAAAPRTLGGGSATVFPPYTVSPLDGLRAALGPDVQVTHAPGIRAHTRVPAADPRLLRRPDGSDLGVEVRFVATDGTVLRSEHRRTSTFVWLGSFGDLPTAHVAAIEVHARLMAEDAGEYTVGCSGVGLFELIIAGVPRFKGMLAMAPEADPVDAMMRPPQHAAGVALTRGEEVAVVLRYELAPGHLDTSFDVPMTAFQLNVEPPHGSDDVEIARAAALAREADAAVAVIGTTEEVESEGYDRESLALPGRQDDLVRAVVAANPRTVVVVNSGAPVLLPWADEVPAVLLAWFPGQEFGNALADVLLGVAEPGGRLPTTWPAATDGLPATAPVEGRLVYDEALLVGYRRDERAGSTARYPFGHGFGYTTWEYVNDVQVAGQAALDEDLVVRLTLRNTGSRSGREVVQVYASRPDSTVPRPARWLVGFAAVDAEPGEERTLSVVVPGRNLAHWDLASAAWCIEPGTFQLFAGQASPVGVSSRQPTPPG